jgi:hypothetical protein
MKITLVRLCIFIALVPLAIGLSAMALHSLLGCTGGLGPGAFDCTHASRAVGEALKGLSWVVMGCLLSVPLALVVAVVGKLLGFGGKDSARKNAA